MTQYTLFVILASFLMNILLFLTRYLLCLNPATHIFVNFAASVHILISKQPAPTDIPHLVCRMNFLKNFADLSMMSPCHCHLIFLSPVHNHHHHYHHFHYASIHVCSTPDRSKLTFSINPSFYSLSRLFGRISHIFMTISGLNCSSVLCFVFLFASFLFVSCDGLSWFNQFLNCTLNPCTFLSFPFYFIFLSIIKNGDLIFPL